MSLLSVLNNKKDEILLMHTLLSRILSIKYKLAVDKVALMKNFKERYFRWEEFTSYLYCFAHSITVIVVLNLVPGKP